MSRDPRILLQDVYQRASKVVEYVAGREREELVCDSIRLEAVLYNLQVIGEAVKKLPDSFREEHPQVAWREIAGMRDIIVHAYFALDLDIIWSAIQDDVPELLKEVERILAQEAPEGS